MDAPWVFPSGHAFYDVNGLPPVLFLGWTPAGHEAVVTWTGADHYELDVVLSSGRVLQEAGRFPDAATAQAAVATIVAVAGGPS